MKNMDVYLQPLADELKELCEGIYTYDVSRPIAIERSFMMYCICAYTIHDYLGYEFALVNYIFIDLFIYITILFHILI